MIDNAPEGPRGVTSVYTAPNAQPYQEGNVNAISIVEEKIPNFSSFSFPWKSMLWHSRVVKISNLTFVESLAGTTPVLS